MAKKYGLWYEFFDTEEDARKYKAEKEVEMTPYMKRAGYYPGISVTTMDNKPTYIVWSRSNTLYCAI